MLMQRTGAESLSMGYAMRDPARTFVEASLREKNPDTTVAAIREGPFLRFYGHESDASMSARSLMAIDEAASQPNLGSDTISFLGYPSGD
jgi:hypothetical protein